MEKCFFCKGIIENSVTNYMLDLNGQFIIIKNVPCHKMFAVRRSIFQLSDNETAGKNCG